MLNDQEVKERTDITMKMSNVTGESADQVSSYMTAIWNNFADGSDNLERFADIITRLGADTASSSEEIAEGLEKFAAVGNTVGLSYEYATSMLATVVAQTRQTPDVVGTSFKTLLARIQDLELGSTLDDGTTLGTYSQALEKVGINIKDTSGQLKDMDVILEEMGSKWQTLGKDQQVALAQNVAGTRQYTQLVALMDNWDFFQENLEAANNAEGSLQEQADIYAESWEGARKRVKASAQAIYSDLIDDDTFIKGTNAVADFLDVTDKLIDNLGGIKTLISTISTIVVSKFSPDIIKGVNQGLESFGLWQNNLKSAGNGENKVISKGKSKFEAIFQSADTIRTQQMKEELQTMRNAALNNPNLTATYKTRLLDMNKIEAIQNEITVASKKLTDEEKDKLKILQEQASTLSEQKQLKQEQFLAIQQEAKELTKNVTYELYDDRVGGIERQRQKRDSRGRLTKEYEYTKGSGISNESIKNQENFTTSIKKLGIFEGLESLFKSKERLNFSLGKSDRTQLYGSETDLETARIRTIEQTMNLSKLETEINNKRELGITNVEQLEKAYTSVVQEALKHNQITEELANEFTEEIKKAGSLEGIENNIGKVFKDQNVNLNKTSQLLGITKERMGEAAEYGKRLSESENEAIRAAENFNSKLNETQNFLFNSIEKAKSLGSVVQSSVQATSSALMALSAIKGVWETFKDEDVSWLDKLGSLAFTAPLIISGLTGMVKNFKEIKSIISSITNLTSMKDSISEAINILGNASELKIQKEITKESLKQNALEEIKNVLEAQGITEEAAELALTKIKNRVENEGTLELTNQLLIEQLINTQKSIGLALSSKTLLIAGAVIAVIAAIGVAIYKYSNRYNEALEDATAATNEAKEAANNAQTEYNNLMSTITDYKDAKSALGQLTKGTDEWKQKVMEINTQVLELMDTYSGLARYVTSEDGVLSIDDEGFKYLTETAYQRAQTAQNTYASKAIEQNKAEDDVTIQQLSKDLNISFNKAEQLINDYNNNIDSARETIEGLDDKVNDANGKVAEAASAVLENTIATSALTDQIATNSFTGQNWYDDSDRKEAYNTAYGLYRNKEIENVTSDTGNPEKYLKWYQENISDLTDEQFVNLYLNTFYKDKGYSMRMTSQGYQVFDEENNKVGEAKQKSEQEKELYFDSLKDSFAKDEVPKIDATLDTLETKISTATDKANLNNEEITKLAVDAYKLKKGEDVDFSSYSSETLDALLKASSRDKDLDGGTQKLVAGAQNYVNTQLYNPAKELTTKEIQHAYTGPYLKRKFDLGVSEVDASAVEDYAKQQYNAAWKKAVNEVAKSQGESKTAVAQVLIEYQDKLGAFSKDNHSFDVDKLTDFYKTQKKAKLTVEIENKAEAVATETGLDSEDIESYAKQLSNMKKYANYSADALTNLAKAQLRYEKAVANSKDNLSDWKKELKKAGKEALLSTETYQGLQDAYGDLFDIDGSLLSDSFIRSTENADLLEKAIKGDTKAYNELKSQVADSIEVKYGLDKDSNFNEQITTLKDTISKDLGDYKAGVDIDVNQKDFYEQINNLANYLYSLGLTAEQVGDVIVSELGIDADVTEVTGEPEEKVVAYDMIPKSTSGTATSVFLPGGNAQNVSAPGIEWETEPVTATLESSTSASSVKVSNASKASGGKIKKAMTGGKSLGKTKKSSSGSKKSPSKKTFKDDFKSSIERYHTIDRKIAKTTKEYEQLADAKDRAYGTNRLKTIDKEIAKIKKQISLEEKKLKQAQKYVKKDKKALVDAAAEAGTDIDFGSDGNITNYQKALKKAEKEVKKAYATKDDDKIEEAENKYDRLVEAITQYEESLDTVTEQKETILELTQQIADEELEKITYKVDLKLEVNERDLKLIQYKLKQWERSSLSGYYDGNYVDQQLNAMSNYQNNYNTYKQGINDILGSAKVGTGKKARSLTQTEINSITNGTASASFLNSLNLTSDQVSTLQNYSDGMLEAAENISDTQDEIYQIFSKNMEQYKDDFEQQMSILEHQKNMVSSLQEIFTLANKDETELMNKMREALIASSETQGLAYRQNMENAVTQMNLLNNRLSQEISDTERKALEENLEEWQNYYRENEENMLSSVQDALDAIKEKLEANVEEIKKLYEEALSGGYGTFSNLELSYDMDDEVRDAYVPAYEKIYNLSKLTQEIQKSMDDTDSIKGKQKLLALQKKINAAMEDNVELTEYDLDRLEAEYQLELAKIALEEAQNAKSTVRMQRDNLGNWSYVYTADEDKVADAMAKYEETIYNLRKLDDERDKELERSIVDINTKYFERLQQIMEMDDGEAKDNALAQLKNWYDAMLSATLSYAETVSKNEKELYETEAEYYEATTGRKIDALGKWITSFSDTSVMIKSGYSSMDEALDGYKNVVDKYTDEVVNEYVKSQNEANNVMAKFGIDADYATNSIDNLNNSLTTTIDKIKELGDNLARITQEDLNKMDYVSQYDSTVENATTEVGNMNKSFATLAGVAGAASGGYTGDWQDTNGKLMFVHQNELILNKDETQALFDLSDLLKKISLPNLLTPTIEFTNLNQKQDKLEQSVTIKAEFPNVTEHNEIEMAIDNLINRASQYANRTY